MRTKENCKFICFLLETVRFTLIKRLFRHFTCFYSWVWSVYMYAVIRLFIVTTEISVPMITYISVWLNTEKNPSNNRVSYKGGRANVIRGHLINKVGLKTQ